MVLKEKRAITISISFRRLCDEGRQVAKGDLVVFPPNEEHWHENKPDAESPFSHISVITQPEGAVPTVVE